MKPAFLRPQAEQDLIEVAAYYAETGGVVLAESVFDAALAALAQISRNPGLGSPRLGLYCDIPGMKSWRLSRFPLQWFYFERPDHLDVVRLLGERQDIAAIFDRDR